jgi:DNA-binding response OmpR family regulator
MSSPKGMKSFPFTAPPLFGMPALIVEPDASDRAFLVAAMTSAGLNVTAMQNFSSARASLLEQPPSLLITEIRLGTYNGLHLALLGRSAQRNMNLIVMSRFHDRVLRREAHAIGAAYIQKPTTTSALLALLYRMVLSEPSAEGTVKPPPLPDRSVNALRQTAVTFGEEKDRRYRKRRREIATFLFWEAQRR